MDSKEASMETNQLTELTSGPLQGNFPTSCFYLDVVLSIYRCKKNIRYLFKAHQIKDEWFIEICQSSTPEPNEETKCIYH